MKDSKQMNMLNLNTLNLWTYRTMGVMMDGGSLTLIFDDPQGDQKQIQFSQHASLKYYKELNDNLPGRIYINKVLVEKRSVEESMVLNYIMDNLIKKLNTDQAELLLKHIRYIISDNYLTSVPINMHLSETRKKHITSIENHIKNL